MFGSPKSLKTFSDDGDINPEWGIFPRVAMQALKRMEKECDPSSYVFTCSCVDLYCMECFDLLNDRQKCHLNNEGIRGFRETTLKTAEDVKKLVNTTASHRVQGATKCNDTSSRSHAIATLRLSRFDKQANTVLESTFIFADLSGSER